MDYTEEQLNKLKKIEDFNQDPSFAVFKEVQLINEKLGEIVNEIASKEMPEYPEIPESKEVVFPDVQKVEVINQQEPVINVNVPDVIVPKIEIPSIIVPEQPAPIVNIDTKELDKGLKDIKDIMSDKPTVENPMPVVLVWKDETYKADGGKETKVIGGFAGGSYLPSIEQNTANTVTAINNLSSSLGGSDFAVVLDDVTTIGMTYVGKAPIGSATSSAVWQIKRIDESGSPNTLVIKWADGDSNYNNIWNNRASLTYN